MNAAPPDRLPARLIELADGCVQCGLCVPQCPTYRLQAQEAESPRGRIALLRGVLEHKLEPGPVWQQHLDQCLGCRRCEAVCPSQVPYSALLDGVRALYPPRPMPWPWPWWLRQLTLHPARWRRTGPWLARLQRLARRVLPARWMAAWPGGSELPAAALAGSSQMAARPAPGGERRPVTLFPGCVTGLLRPELLRDAEHVLQALGHAVTVPDSYACCGALPLHQGQTALFEQACAVNRAALPADEPLLGLDSACSGTLQQEAALPQAQDIHAWLAQQDWSERALQPVPWRVALWHPCTQRHVLRGEGAVEAVLARIPALQVETLPASLGCCGAAGLYHRQHPQLAGQLRDALLDDLIPRQVDALLVSNIGCALWLQEGLQQRGQSCPVLHPLNLLARSLA